MKQNKRSHTFLAAVQGLGVDVHGSIAQGDVLPFTSIAGGRDSGGIGAQAKGVSQTRRQRQRKTREVVYGDAFEMLAVAKSFDDAFEIGGRARLQKRGFNGFMESFRH